MMHMGERFCLGGKKARRFKKRDPAIDVPGWCPRRKDPCELSFDPEKGELGAHIHAQLQYELLNCKSSYRRYGFTGAPRDLRGAVMSLNDCRELAAA